MKDLFFNEVENDLVIFTPPTLNNIVLNIYMSIIFNKKML